MLIPEIPSGRQRMWPIKRHRLPGCLMVAPALGRKRNNALPEGSAELFRPDRGSPERDAHRDEYLAP